MQCEANRDFALRNRTNPSDDVSDCTPQRSAMCFEIRAGSPARVLCLPTIGICRGQNDWEKHQGHAAGQVTDCHPLE
jgi:hypothetical protein